LIDVVLPQGALLAHPTPASIAFAATSYSTDPGRLRDLSRAGQGAVDHR
jgi:hypothetical protein